jgi:glycosyltransferase involved in cell wall biosynthesis
VTVAEDVRRSDVTAAGTARPRILVIGSGWRFLSGISFHTCHLSNALAARFEVAVILMRSLLPARLYPGRARVGAAITAARYDDAVRVHDGVDWWGRGLFTALRLIREQRPDVVVMQWWTGTVVHSYLILAAYARRRGASVTLEMHEMLDTGEASMPLVCRYVDYMFPKLLSRVDRLVVHSEQDVRAVRERHGDDIPVDVVTLGPLTHLPRSERTPRPQGVTRLLSFGVIRPYKGLEHLIEAFDALTPEEAERFTLTIVGETWEGWDVPAEMIAASPHRDRITFVNRYVTDEEMSRHFAEADVMVLPYLRSSGSGPLVQAMVDGLPVIVSDIESLRHSADSYTGAYFVPPADAGALRDAMFAVEPLVGVAHEDPTSWDAAIAYYERLAGTP